MKIIIPTILAIISIFAIDGHLALEVNETDAKEDGAPFIAYGEETTIGEYPYTVYLLFYSGPADSPTTEYGCGGVILCKNYIITTAWCAADVDNVRIYFGMDDPTPGNYHSYELTKAAFRLHHQYQPNTEVHDIALITLPAPIEFTPRVQPAKLYAGSTADEMTEFLNNRAWVAGSGVTETGSYSGQLLETKFRIVDNAQCSNYYTEAYNTCQICATALTENAGLCTADYGNGLLVKEETVIGIHSYGACEEGVTKPYVFTRISCYREWLKKYTKNCLPKGM